ncbi:MAG: C4-dicarboxylate ABC transporter [Paracoccaceae bacterium]|nr:MAG: C4-dicarboxylate ABC transporter [Paracoccaceae bacterium]
MLSVLFDTGVRRQLHGRAGLLTRAIAAATAAWVIYAAAFSRGDALSLTMTFFALMLVLTFLMIGPRPRASRHRIGALDWGLVALSAATGVHFVRNADAIAQRITLLDPLSGQDIFFAVLGLVLAIEAVRRTVGLGLTLIVILFSVYNLYGHHLGGLLGHGYIPFTHFLDITFFTTDGLFGTPLRVAATYAFLFVLFGTALSQAGGAKFFYDISAWATGTTAGGPAKIAVISSGLYGTISGSPTSDVVTTGSVTIPMMRQMGYRPAFAASVEVAASTGGSLLPPVMGAAAFIMAEYTGIDYVQIALAALIPALLYYVPIYAQVHFRARKEGLAGVDRTQIPPLASILREGGVFVVPLVVISWALLNGYTPTYSAVYGTAALYLVSLPRAATRLGVRAVFRILADTAVRMVPVAGACAAAGLVIGGITMTGLASKFSALVFLVSGQDLLVSLLVAAALTTLLGMGMPTPSAYILAAVLIAPALTALQLDLMAAHLFVLYFAVMSALTPPVAVAAYAASAIAGENPLRIAVASVRLALGAFLIPFAFVYHPGLILQDGVAGIALAAAGAAVGLVALAAAVEGFLTAPLGALPRLGLAAAGALLLLGDAVVKLGGVGLLAAMWLWQRARAGVGA